MNEWRNAGDAGAAERSWGDVQLRIDRGGTVPISAARLGGAQSSGEVFDFSMMSAAGVPTELILAPQIHLVACTGGLRESKLEIQTSGPGQLRYRVKSPEERSPVDAPWQTVGDFAFGFHSGHTELDDLAALAGAYLQSMGKLPKYSCFTGACDGVMQGRESMFWSLLFRDLATEAFAIQLRMNEQSVGCLGFAGCDKETPGLVGALGRLRHMPCVVLLSGSNIPPSKGLDSGPVQGIVSLFSTGSVPLGEAQEHICRACGSAGGACSFGGTAFGNQNMCVALGLSLPRAAAVPSNTDVFYDQAILSAKALLDMIERRVITEHILTPEAVADAIYMMMAIGGSQNLLMHIPAMAENAGVYQQDVGRALGMANPRKDIRWLEVFEFAMGKVGPFVSVTPNGPHRSVDYWFAGGAPEVLCCLEERELLHLDRPTVAGTLGDVLAAWRESPERGFFRERLGHELGVDPDEVIIPPKRAASMVQQGELPGRTYVLPSGNLGQGVTKSSAIPPKLLDAGGVFYRQLPVRVFATQAALLEAAKAGEITGQEIIVLLNQGLQASGLPENAMLSNFVKNRADLHGLVVLTSARVSGFEGGTVTISQIIPEELDNGPLGKLLDGDIVRVSINVHTGEAEFNLVGEKSTTDSDYDPQLGARILAGRPTRDDIDIQPGLHPSAQLLAALIAASGGPFQGRVEPHMVLSLLDKGKHAQDE